MARWKVWNRHPNGLTHKEKFQDNIIEIPAGNYVLMDYEDAVQFRGQYFPMKTLPTSEKDPAGFKCIHLEKHDQDESEISQGAKAKEFICHLDGKVFSQEKDLIEYVKQNYSDKIVMDEVAEAELKSKKSKGTP